MPSRRLLVAGVAACAVAAGVGWALRPADAGRPLATAEGGRGRMAAAPPAAPPVTAGASAAQVAPTSPVPGPDSGWIATLHGPLTWSAQPGGPPSGTLAATDPFGAADVVALVGRPRGDGWALAELPVRPDGSTGWIDTAATTLTTTPYRVAISLSGRTLTVTDGAATVLQVRVAIGAPPTPTPPASTYVWELVRPDDPSGPYGPYILGLAEFSTTIATFNGGDAQIAVHGTNSPWTIGEAVSHGCVHVDDATVTRLAGLLPLGTPVEIS